jgi:dGTPase
VKLFCPIEAQTLQGHVQNRGGKKFRDYVTDSNCPTFLDALKAKYPRECGNNVYDHFVDSLFGGGGERKHFISRLVHHFMTSVMIHEIEDFDEPLIRYRAAMPEGHRKFLDALKKTVAEEVIKSPNVQHLEFKGQKMVVSVFEAFESDPKSFLPGDTYQKFISAGSDSRVICDYVAGMTDAFHLKTYDRLFSPRMTSVFDRL